MILGQFKKNNLPQRGDVPAKKDVSAAGIVTSGNDPLPERAAPRRTADERSAPGGAFTRKAVKAPVIFLIAVFIALSIGIPLRSGAADLVIVLDPGHGGVDSGATHTVDGKEYRERECNLTITLSVKKYLEEYKGVTVRMTREGNEELTLAQRVSIANRFGANVLVSIHNNSSDGKASGAVVVAAASTFRPEITKMTQALGNNVLASLHTIDLQNRGLLTTMANTATYKEYYPDGSLQDYYGIVMRSMRAGFPGIIVECCFIDNDSDVINYLSSAEQMDGVGRMIADGIAKTYGLSKETAISVEPRHPVDGRSLSFDESYARDLFFPLDGTTLSGEKEAVFTRPGGARVYLDYMGMAVNTSDFSHAVITMKGSSGGEKLKIYVGDELVTVPRDDFAYDVTLTDEYQTYVIDFTKLPVWDKAFNFFRFDLSGGDSFSIKSLAFHPAGDECREAVLPFVPTVKPTEEPTPTPAPTERPVSTPVPSPVPTLIPTDGPTDVPDVTDQPSPGFTESPAVNTEGVHTPDSGNESALPTDEYSGNATGSPKPIETDSGEAGPSGGTIGKTLLIVMIVVTVILLIAVLFAAFGAGKNSGGSRSKKKK